MPQRLQTLKTKAFGPGFALVLTSENGNRPNNVIDRGSAVVTR